MANRRCLRSTLQTPSSSEPPGSIQVLAITSSRPCCAWVKNVKSWASFTIRLAHRHLQGIWHRQSCRLFNTRYSTPKKQRKSIISAMKVFAVGMTLQKQSLNFRILHCTVKPIETIDYPTPAKRPHYSLLNKAKIKNTFDITIPYWKDSLQECLDVLKGNKQ